jgi:hypothetical protein
VFAIGLVQTLKDEYNHISVLYKPGDIGTIYRNTAMNIATLVVIGIDCPSTYRSNKDMIVAKATHNLQ